jgi:hypothetical protein
MTKNRIKNYVAKDLRSPKYRMRVAVSKKVYNRKNNKKEVVDETKRI